MPAACRGASSTSRSRWSAICAAGSAMSRSSPRASWPSLSGSAVADAAALGALLLPMMAAAGHNRARSAGLIAAGGIIAPVIPPSIGFVIFGVAANVSITKLFLAGIVPGLMLGAGAVRRLVVGGAQGEDQRAAAQAPRPRSGAR